MKFYNFFFFVSLLPRQRTKRRPVFHLGPPDHLLFVFLSFAGGREGWGKGGGSAALPGPEKNRSLLLLIAIHQLNVIVSNRSCASSRAQILRSRAFPLEAPNDSDRYFSLPATPWRVRWGFFPPPPPPNYSF